jgi:hypothetical protein
MMLDILQLAFAHPVLVLVHGVTACCAFNARTCALSLQHVLAPLASTASGLSNVHNSKECI